jgi:hypothetical protein
MGLSRVPFCEAEDRGLLGPAVFAPFKFDGGAG